MVNHELRCIFIEVPKTASTSIRELIGHPVKPHLDLLETRALLQHEARMTRIDGVEDWVEDIMSGYLKFSVVRNPWDRVVSLYHRREGLQPRHHLTFEQFVDRLEYASDTCIHPSPHRNQVDWLKDAEGRIGVDEILRFETIDNDWLRTGRRLGIDQALPHANRNPDDRQPYSTFYDGRLRDRVAALFAEDIEALGYRFDG